MSALVTTFALVAFAALQALLPGWSGMGYAKPPLLLAVVIYYALTRRRSTALTVAVVTGLFQDLLSLSPAGCTLLPYLLVAAVINNYREEVFILHPITHALFGAAAAMAADLATSLLLAMLVPGANLGAAAAMARAIGSGMLAALAVPLVYQSLWRLDRALGNVDSRGMSWR